MKSKVISSEAPKVLGFPKLMRHKTLGGIVLFSSVGTGTLVYQGHIEYPIGEWDENWTFNDYEDFHETVELSND